MIPPDVEPLLVLVNVKSGGCQGTELLSAFRRLLNPFQVFDVLKGGPLVGFVFVHFRHFNSFLVSMFFEIFSNIEFWQPAAMALLVGCYNVWILPNKLEKTQIY